MPQEPSDATGQVRATVVGIGADGWPGLAAAARELVASAAVVVGGERHLDLLPAVPGQRRVAWPRPFDVGVVEQHPGCVVLASGDPMLSGVGTTLVRRLGAGAVAVHPHVSSVALARARMGWSAEESVVLTTVGRHVERVLREVAPHCRLLVLSSDATTPEAVAGLLTAHGWGSAELTVLGDLGGPGESRHSGRAESWSVEAPALHVLAIACGEGGPVLGWAPGLPDSAYEHDGQLTKRDVRASALARLAPCPGELLWDLGAGAGSVAIEWSRSHATCAAYAVERQPERAATIARNARRLGVPDVQVLVGESGALLDGLPDPDAIFVGGGATAAGVVDRCVARLRPGGRLVVHGVTLETERVLADARATHGGELTRLSVETAAPVGSFTGWTPARAVTQWSLVVGGAL